MSNNELIHPRIIIQPDWFTNLRSNTLPVDVWLEYKSGSSSVSHATKNIHGVCSIKPLIDKDDEFYKTSTSDNFQSTDIDKKMKTLRITIRNTEFSHIFQGPIKSFSTHEKSTTREINDDLNPLVHASKPANSRMHQTQLTAHPHWFDISSGGVGLTALSNGLITIWDIENGDVRRQLQGHIEDVYIARFFPSNFAVISGGADMRVKIWSFDNENSHITNTTLTGHRSRINDVLALDQQHVLSASNDGSVILWDIKKNQQINKIVQLDSNGINSINLINHSLLVCGCDDGYIRLYNVNQTNKNDIIGQINTNDPVNALCHLTKTNQFVYGTEHSMIGICDIRHISDVQIHSWKEQRGRITSINESKHLQGILVTTADGSCFECDDRKFKSTIDDTFKFDIYDYTGAEDLIYNGKIFNNRIYTICRDKLVRVYDKQE